MAEVSWVEKYAPKEFSSIIGHKEIVPIIQRWADDWQNDKKSPALLFNGSPGIGKTTVAYVLSYVHNWEIIELNASDLRNKDEINKIIGSAMQTGSLFGKKKLLLLDEVDGTAGREDSGGVGAITEIIKEPNYPVILTSNDCWHTKLKTLRNYTNIIDFKKVNVLTLAAYLKKICESEGIKAHFNVLKAIAANAGGDVRFAINTLEAIARGRKELFEEDLNTLSGQDVKEKVMNALRVIFKTSKFGVAHEVIRNLEEEPGMFMAWVAENMPKEYKKPEDIDAAMESLSRADVFMGRISRRQYWAFLKYISILYSAGVALAKAERYEEFVPYSFPSKILRMSATKSARAKLAESAAKIGKVCHCSTKEAIETHIPTLDLIFRKDPEKGANLCALFNFDEEDLKRFDLDARISKKLLEGANALTQTNIKNALFHAQDSGGKQE